MSKAPNSDVRYTEFTNLSTADDKIHANTGSTKKSKESRQMLTAVQLSDLFRRLDSDASGELDMDEFLKITSKLKINDDEDFIVDVFRSVDTNNSGKLNMNEFIAAYQKVYIGMIKNRSKHVSNSTYVKIKDYITALRYGHDKNGSYIFDIYRGDFDNINEILKFHCLDEKLNFAEHFTQQNVNESGESITLSALNDLIVSDSKTNTNSSGKSSINWWVDIAMDGVSRSKMDNYITVFGLPNDTYFRSRYAAFNKPLPQEKKSRLFAGKGTNSTGNSISSVSLFVQSMWIKNRPIVHHLPEKIIKWGNKYSQPVLKYYNDKLAFLTASLLSERSSIATKLDKADAIEVAVSIAGRLHDDENFCVNTSEDFKSGSVIPREQLKRRTDLPQWLHTLHHVRNNPASIEVNTLGINLISTGHGCNCVITVREIDPEHLNDRNISVKSRTGVLGRILDSIRIKIFEVMCHKGSAVVCGELDDCPAALVTTIISLVHAFSMDTISSLDYWLNLIDSEVATIAVSKHPVHKKMCDQTLQNILDYVNPSFDILNSFYEESCREKVSRPEAVYGHESIVSLPDGIEKLDVTYDVIRPFLANDPSQYLGTIIEGNDGIEIKGFKYWKQQMEALKIISDTVGENIAYSLDEKRNFYSFLLTVATIYLAPLSILTGYFGMNFDNMHELEAPYVGPLKGVQLLWVVLGFSYAVFLALSIHWRVLYSAT